MNKWVNIGIGALSDFVITAGTAYVTMMSQPSIYQLSICVVGGLVAAARGIQKTLTPPPA